ncbi:MAG: hypothetical protein NUV91_09430, partial [Candidatus Omnitrophica bacterium]|nr:hypothetical protein [Candidatus Omnitrophota bacterium]
EAAEYGLDLVYFEGQGLHRLRGRADDLVYVELLISDQGKIYRVRRMVSSDDELEIGEREFLAEGHTPIVVYEVAAGAAPDSFEQGEPFTILGKWENGTTMTRADGRTLQTYIIEGGEIKTGQEGHLRLGRTLVDWFRYFPNALVKIKVIDGKLRYVLFVQDQNGKAIANSDGTPFAMDLRWTEFQKFTAQQRVANGNGRNILNGKKTTLTLLPTYQSGREFFKQRFGIRHASNRLIEVVYAPFKERFMVWKKGYLDEHRNENHWQRYARWVGIQAIRAGTVISVLFVMAKFFFLLSMGVSIHPLLVLLALALTVGISDIGIHMLWNLIVGWAPLTTSAPQVIEKSLSPAEALQRFLKGQAQEIASQEVTILSGHRGDARTRDLYLPTPIGKVSGLDPSIGEVGQRALVVYSILPSSILNIRVVEAAFYSSSNGDHREPRDSKRIYFVNDEGRLKPRVVVRTVKTWVDELRAYKDRLTAIPPRQGFLVMRTTKYGALGTNRIAGFDFRSLPNSLGNPDDEIRVDIKRADDQTWDLIFEFRPINAPTTEPAHAIKRVLMAGSLDQGTATVALDRNGPDQEHYQRVFQALTGVAYETMADQLEHTSAETVVAKALVFLREGLPIYDVWLRQGRVVLEEIPQAIAQGKMPPIVFDLDPRVRERQQAHVRDLLESLGEIPERIQRMSDGEIYVRIQYLFNKHDISFIAPYWVRIETWSREELLTGAPRLRFLHFILSLYGLTTVEERNALIQANPTVFLAARRPSRYLNPWRRAIWEYLGREVHVPLARMMEITRAPRHQRQPLIEKELKVRVEGQKTGRSVGELKQLLKIYGKYLRTASPVSADAEVALKSLRALQLSVKDPQVKDEIALLIPLFEDIVRGVHPLVDWQKETQRMREEVFVAEYARERLAGRDPKQVLLKSDAFPRLFDRDELLRRAGHLAHERKITAYQAWRVLGKSEAEEIERVGLYVARRMSEADEEKVFISYGEILRAMKLVVLQSEEDVWLALGALVQEGFLFQYQGCSEQGPENGVRVLYVPLHFERAAQSKDFSRRLAEDHFRKYLEPISRPVTIHSTGKVRERIEKVWKKIRQIEAEAVTGMGRAVEEAVSRALTLPETYIAGREFFRRATLGLWKNAPDWVIEIFFAPFHERKMVGQKGFLEHHENQTEKQKRWRRVGIALIKKAGSWLGVLVHMLWNITIRFAPLTTGIPAIDSQRGTLRQFIRGEVMEAEAREAQILEHQKESGTISTLVTIDSVHLSGLDPRLGRKGARVRVVFEAVPSQVEGIRAIDAFVFPVEMSNGDEILYDVRRIFVRGEKVFVRSIKNLTDWLRVYAEKLSDEPPVSGMTELYQPIEGELSVIVGNMHIRGLPSSLGRKDQPVRLVFSKVDDGTRDLWIDFYSGFAPVTEPAHARKRLCYPEDSRPTVMLNKLGADQMHHRRAFEAETGERFESLPSDIQALSPELVRQRARVFIELGEPIRATWLDRGNDPAVLHQRLQQARAERHAAFQAAQERKAYLVRREAVLRDISVPDHLRGRHDRDSFYLRILNIFIQHGVGFSDFYWPRFKWNPQEMLEGVVELRFLHFVLSLYGLTDLEERLLIIEQNPKYFSKALSARYRLNILTRVVSKYLSREIRIPAHLLHAWIQMGNLDQREAALHHLIRRNIISSKNENLRRERYELLKIYDDHLKDPQSARTQERLAQLRKTATQSVIIQEIEALIGLFAHIQRGVDLQQEWGVERAVFNDEETQVLDSAHLLLPGREFPIIFREDRDGLLIYLGDWAQRNRISVYRAWRIFARAEAREIETLGLLLAQRGRGAVISYEAIARSSRGVVLTARPVLHRALGILAQQGFLFRYQEVGVEILDVPFHFERAALCADVPRRLMEDPLRIYSEQIPRPMAIYSTGEVRKRMEKEWKRIHRIEEGAAEILVREVMEARARNASGNGQGHRGNGDRPTENRWQSSQVFPLAVLDPAWARPGYGEDTVQAELYALVRRPDRWGDIVTMPGVQRVTPENIPEFVWLALDDAIEQNDVAKINQTRGFIHNGQVFYGEAKSFYGANDYDNHRWRGAIYFIATNVDLSKGEPTPDEIFVHETNLGTHGENMQVVEKYRERKRLRLGQNRGVVRDLSVLQNPLIAPEHVILVPLEELERSHVSLFGIWGRSLNGIQRLQERLGPECRVVVYSARCVGNIPLRTRTVINHFAQGRPLWIIDDRLLRGYRGKLIAVIQYPIEAKGADVFRDLEPAQPRYVVLPYNEDQEYPLWGQRGLFSPRLEGPWVFPAGYEEVARRVEEVSGTRLVGEVARAIPGFPEAMLGRMFSISYAYDVYVQMNWLYLLASLQQETGAFPQGVVNLWLLHKNYLTKNGWSNVVERELVRVNQWLQVRYGHSPRILVVREGEYLYCSPGHPDGERLSPSNVTIDDIVIAPSSAISQELLIKSTFASVRQSPDYSIPPLMTGTGSYILGALTAVLTGSFVFHDTFIGHLAGGGGTLSTRLGYVRSFMSPWQRFMSHALSMWGIYQKVHSVLLDGDLLKHMGERELDQFAQLFRVSEGQLGAFRWETLKQFAQAHEVTSRLARNIVQDHPLVNFEDHLGESGCETFPVDVLVGVDEPERHLRVRMTNGRAEIDLISDGQDQRNDRTFLQEQLPNIRRAADAAFDVVKREQGEAMPEILETEIVIHGEMGPLAEVSHDRKIYLSYQAVRAPPEALAIILSDEIDHLLHPGRAEESHHRLYHRLQDP